jgi:hypothetical protein
MSSRRAHINDPSMDELPVELLSKIVHYLTDWRDHFHLAHTATYYYRTVFSLVRSVSLVRIVRKGNIGTCKYLSEATMANILPKYSNLVELNLYAHLPDPTCLAHLTTLQTFRYLHPSPDQFGLDQFEPSKWRSLFEFLLTCPLQILQLVYLSEFYDILKTLQKPLAHATRFDVSDIKLEHLDTLSRIVPNLECLKLNLRFIGIDRSDHAAITRYLQQLRDKLIQFKQLRSLTLTPPPIWSCEQLPDLSALKLTRFTLRLTCYRSHPPFITLRGIQSIPVTNLILYQYNHQDRQLSYLHGHPTLRHLTISNSLARFVGASRRYHDDPQRQDEEFYGPAARDFEPLQQETFKIEYHGPKFSQKYYRHPVCRVNKFYRELINH